MWECDVWVDRRADCVCVCCCSGANTRGAYCAFCLVSSAREQEERGCKGSRKVREGNGGRRKEYSPIHGRVDERQVGGSWKRQRKRRENLCRDHRVGKKCVVLVDASDDTSESERESC